MLITLFLIFTLSFIAAADKIQHDVVERNQTCIDACSDWSIVLGHCREMFGTWPAQENATFANQFLGCCCNGEEKDVILGSEALLKSASMCQECYTTPPPVRKDLRMLVELCPKQQQEGEIEEATTFWPASYSTAEDVSKAAIEEGSDNSANHMSLGSTGGILGMVLSIVLGVLVI